MSILKLPSAVSSYIQSGLIDEVLMIIKAGKEGTIYLAKQTREGIENLFVVKVYKPKAYRSFKRDRIYKQGMFTEERRARYGSSWERRTSDVNWVTREFQFLREAQELGVPAPIPVQMTENTILMTYIGDEDQPAPKLVDVYLGKNEAHSAFDQVITGVRLLYEGEIIHADLSAYNILWFGGQTYFIDFPQAVKVYENPYALDLLYRDIGNVCHYFNKMGINGEPKTIFRDITGFRYHMGYSFDDYVSEI